MHEDGLAAGADEVGQVYHRGGSMEMPKPPPIFTTSIADPKVESEEPTASPANATVRVTRDAGPGTRARRPPAGRRPRSWLGRHIPARLLSPGCPVPP